MGVGQGGGPSSNRGGYSGSNNSYFGGYGFGGPSRNLGLYSGGYHVNNSYGSNHPAATAVAMSVSDLTSATLTPASLPAIGAWPRWHA